MPLFNTLLIAACLALLTYILPQWGQQPWPLDGAACTAPLGHPEKMTVAGVEYNFQYDAKGRIVSRSGNGKEYQVEYVWQHDHPIDVMLTYPATDDSEEKTYEWHFIYDSNQNVVYATDFDNEEAWFAYNDQGEMISIKSSLGHRFEFSYDPQCHELSKISRSDGVCLDIKMNAQCERIYDDTTEPTPTQYLMLNQLSTTLNMIRYTDFSLVPQAE